MMTEMYQVLNAKRGLLFRKMQELPGKISESVMLNLLLLLFPALLQVILVITSALLHGTDGFILAGQTTVREEL